MMPHVRMWERLQSSHVHLKLDERNFKISCWPHLWIINVFKNYSFNDRNKPPSIIAVWTVWNAEARRQHSHGVGEVVISTWGFFIVGQLKNNNL